ncbi:5'-nucleotidase C-terminal domain-containing protein [Curtobacterium sp. MCPF17_050]|uniref:bifunctional metallophosphatase/5'-nucleotidase n=1 Tax=Curtobacterium sp. MCPF17_050 TaxID=2175664 RepID=UPI000D97DE1C|nr:bifunctional UDP-sugar hydrolase/5'-nucleotidase [Curtobacterium sp. MCPF17_050]WIB14875.1 5'-nucleotidase C-terminal domain-containing protein [Curtobacterium sp. MCPF17_050]
MSPSHFPEPTPRRRRGIVAGTALATAGVLVALGAPATAAEVPAGATAPVTVAAAGDTTIDLYNVNDFHGRIVRSISQTAGKPTPRDGDAAGAATLAGALDQLRGPDRSTSAFVSSGDNIGGSTFESFIQQDQPTIDVLNQMDLSVSAIGNHELDKGQADLRDRVIGADGARNAQWDYVSANILDSATGEPAFDPYSIQEISGKRVGFIGATVDLVGQGLVSPDGITGLEMGDITTEVNKVATQLTDGDPSNDEADVLVLLVHDGAESSAATDLDGASDFARAVRGVSPEVSAILSAHTHQTYVHQVPVGDGTATRPVIQTGSYGFNLGHVQLTVAADGTVTATKAENLKLVDEGAYPKSAAVQATVDAAVAEADELGAVELGTVDRDLERAVQTNGSENRGGESLLGNFVAEVQRAQTQRQGSQIAFMNPGGLRDDIAAGAVTYKEAAAVQSFANTLVVLDLTGEQIRQALEQQWQPTTASRPFLKLGASEGFSYTYDAQAAAGSRITSMTLDGDPIDADTIYKVTVNSFLAGGGDNFGAFKQAAVKQDSGKVDLEAQVEYFQAHPAVEVAVDQRAVGVTTTPEPEGGFQPGDEVTVDLSSLVFSNAGDQSGTVSVSAGGTELASAPIDTTVVDTTDEQGRASLTFTVPEPGAATPGEPTTPTERARPAAAAVETSDEPLVVELPSGQRITLAVTVPVLVAPAPGEEPVPVPGTDPTVPADPTTPAVPVPTDPDGGLVAVPIAGGGSDDADGGPLAYTGAGVAGPALAAVLLLLAGVTALVLARRKRAAHDATVHADR